MLLLPFDFEEVLFVPLKEQVVLKPQAVLPVGAYFEKIVHIQLNHPTDTCLTKDSSLLWRK